MTRQTSVFPMALATNITANMVYCKVLSHLDWDPGSSLKFASIVEFEAVMLAKPDMLQIFLA